MVVIYMFAPVKAKTGFQDIHHKKTIVTLLIAVLISSLCACVFMNNSNGTSLENAVQVKNEEELRKAINNRDIVFSNLTL